MTQRRTEPTKKVATYVAIFNKLKSLNNEDPLSKVLTLFIDELILLMDKVGNNQDLQLQMFNRVDSKYQKFAFRVKEDPKLFKNFFLERFPQLEKKLENDRSKNK